jgi:hypothetical protein
VRLRRAGRGGRSGLLRLAPPDMGALVDAAEPVLVVNSISGSSSSANKTVSSTESTNARKSFRVVGQFPGCDPSSGAALCARSWKPLRDGSTEQTFIIVLPIAQAMPKSSSVGRAAAGGSRCSEGSPLANTGRGGVRSRAALSIKRAASFLRHHGRSPELLYE